MRHRGHDVAGQMRQPRPPTHQSHAAEVHQEPTRGPPRHPDTTDKQIKRQHRSKSVPNSKPSHKHNSDSKPSKDKGKHSSSNSKSSRNKEDKKNKHSTINLPDFIPIHHVTPPVNYPPPEPSRYDYGPQQARLIQAPHINRGRPGVGVMFNPDMGATDF